MQLLLYCCDETTMAAYKRKHLIWLMVSVHKDEVKEQLSFHITKRREGGEGEGEREIERVIIVNHRNLLKPRSWPPVTYLLQHVS